MFLWYATFILQQNADHLTHTGPDTSQIIKYSGISTGTYTDQVLTDNFCLLLIYMVCTTNRMSIPFGYLRQSAGSGSSGSGDITKSIYRHSWRPF